MCRGALRTGQDYEEITYEFLKKCHSENIIYSEIMFDPQQGLRQGVKLEALLEGLFSGARAANQEFGISTQWIMNFQRDHPVNDACNILEHAQSYKDDIVGIGLDNPEIYDFPNKFTPLFQYAKEQGYRLTSHCDVHQSNTMRHIRDCIEVLGVERIDHGLNALDDDELVAQLVEKNIALTGCPNRYAYQPENASSDDLGMMLKLLEKGVLVSINSDDPAQFGSGWLTQTMIEAQKNGNLSSETMIKFMRCSFQSAWLPEDQKVIYLHRLECFSDGYEWDS
ncbi:MAG: adenosine deaminase [Parasphingorhabdus sp.]